MPGVILILLGFFFGLGFLIASSVAKNRADLVGLGILFGFGLMLVAGGVIFAGCAIALNGAHL